MAHVLVVDDGKLLSTQIARALCGAGHSVDLASNAGDAWRVLETRRIDVMLLDLDTPRLDGLAFLAMLRKIPDWADLPTVICSARRDRDSVLRAKELKAHDYLLKSDNLVDQLLKRLDAALTPSAAR